MGSYLARLVRLTDVTVVDGSRPDLLAAHRAAWPDGIRVITPDGRQGVNGKVVGALSGITATRHEMVVLADDDVRYDEASLSAVHQALGAADVVRPQNVYTHWPWHARWDFCRALVARAVSGDWPGTFGLRASAVEAMGGWSADVLFENLEMVRTAQAAGHVVATLPGLVVGRRPPPAAHFWSQRVRQAYDDLAQPGRLALEMGIVPVVVAATLWRPRLLVPMAAATVALAEAGRRRHGGLDIPRSVPLWAPAWVLERGVCIWVALGARARGGVRYHGRRLRVAAHPQSALVNRPDLPGGHRGRRTPPLATLTSTPGTASRA
jgi:hypothetical protein